MSKYNLDPTNKVAIISGKDFRLEMFNVQGQVPASTAFTMYFIKSDVNLRHKCKLFHCEYLVNGSPCNQMHRGIFNFFSHLRHHTGEKPYKCTFTNCNSTFTQKGSLKMHLDLHRGIKKYQCETCGKRFSKGYNLKAHHNS